MSYLKIDTLKEYHVQAANSKIRHLTENIVALFKENNPTDSAHLLHLIERLLAELNFLKKYYNSSAMAEQLELDIEEATYLIEQLKSSYNIDDPIVWLKGVIAQINKTKLAAKTRKSELMRGLQAITQAEDTAEERKLRDRKVFQPLP